MLDELAHAGPEHLDEEFIAGYDRKQGYPGAAGDIAAFESAGLDAASQIVDLAAGTGQFAVPAAKRFGHVTAADVSPAMVAALRKKAAAADAANLEIVRAGFLSYTHMGPPADGVFTRNGLHQIPDFWKGVALTRIAGLLRPGGVLLLRDFVYDFQPAEAAGIFEDWLANCVTDPAAGYTAADIAEHIRTEHSTYRWLLEPMLDAAGLEIADVRFHHRRYAAYTCVRR